MSKFDLDKFIEEYTKLYDNLPDDVKPEDDAKGPNKKPSKKNRPPPADLKSRIKKVIDDTAKNTACASCPKMGKCRKLNWKGDHTFILVTGCSSHPDQTKFKGHSTTVSITSTQAYGMQRNTDTTWNAAWVAASAVDVGGIYLAAYSSYYNTDPLYLIARMGIVFDTSAIPADAILDSGYIQFYAVTKYENSSIQIQKGTVAHPADAILVGDYDKSYASGNCGAKNVVDFTTDQYNDITLTDLTCITKAGTTRIYIREATYDIAGTEPLVETNIYGINGNGSEADNPPKLSITYDMPQFITRSLNKKQMVI
jgi:hypothetical protein